MSMTKRHFERFAADIRAGIERLHEQQGRDAQRSHLNRVFTPHWYEGQRAGLRLAALRFAEMAAEDNPAFNEERFLSACGLI